MSSLRALVSVTSLHKQCVMMMSAIYKCYKDSELEEVLVAGVIAEFPVEHALKGKHNKRLVYETQLRNKDFQGYECFSSHLCCCTYNTGG